MASQQQEQPKMTQQVVNPVVQQPGHSYGTVEDSLPLPAAQKKEAGSSVATTILIVGGGIVVVVVAVLLIVCCCCGSGCPGIYDDDLAGKMARLNFSDPEKFEKCQKELAEESRRTQEEIEALRSSDPTKAKEKQDKLAGAENKYAENFPKEISKAAKEQVKTGSKSGASGNTEPSGTQDAKKEIGKAMEKAQGKLQEGSGGLSQGDTEISAKLGEAMDAVGDLGDQMKRT